MPRVSRTAEQEEARLEDPDLIESLDRGLRVLLLLGAERRPTTLSDVAGAANLSRATTRRILRTLERAGYVESDGKLFYLTMRVIGLASAFLSSNQVVSVLQAPMDDVASRLKETCGLAVLDEESAVFIARASPARIFAGGPDIGYRLPAFCTSVGRALLGRFGEDELGAAIARFRLHRPTPETIVDRDLLVATILRDRNQGFSLVDQEAEADFRSISVPIRRYDGVIVAALNIGVHVDRIGTGEMIDRFLPVLRETADRVKPLLV